MKRDKAIDIAKALGIIAVVAAHAGLKIAPYASLFYMPLFIFLSGYVFNETYSFKELFKKKIKGLYIPFLIYECIFLVLRNLLYHIHIYATPYKILDFFKAGIHILLFDNVELMLAPIWFLTAIFLITLLFKIILNIKEKYNLYNWVPIVVSLLLMIVGLKFTEHGINLSVSFNFQEVFNVTLTSLIFFTLGYYAKKAKKIKFNNIIIAIISIIALILAVKHGYTVDTRVNFYNKTYLILPIAIAGIYLTIFISKMIEKIPKINDLMVYVGKNTIPILALHIIMFKLVGMVQIYVFKYFPVNSLTGWNVFYYNKKWQYALIISGIVIPLIINWIARIIKTKIVSFKNEKNGETEIPSKRKLHKSIKQNKEKSVV